jgi:beta-alanine--pyruvate transaminase
MRRTEGAIRGFSTVTPYSGHPLACAAAQAVTDIYEERGLFDSMQIICLAAGKAVHSLKGSLTSSISTDLGLVAGMGRNLTSQGVLSAYDCLVRCFENGF